MREQRRSNPFRSAITTFFVVLTIVVLYAIAVQETEINLQRALEPGRQESVVRVLRLLADPDILAVDEETGAIVPSETTLITLERIVETILMALLASIIGTLLAIPVSFIAARNLMAGVSAPLAAIMASLAALPVGGWLAGKAAGSLVALSAEISQQGMMGLGALALTAVLIWPVLRAGPPILSDKRRPRGVITLSVLRLIAAALLFLFGLGLLAHLGLVAGRWLQAQLDAFDFIGNSIYVMADFVRVALPGLTALLVALIAASLGSRYGQEAVLKLEGTPARFVTAVLAVLGTAVLVYGIGATLNWLYQFDNPTTWTTIPAIVGGVIIGALSLLVAPKRPFPIGFTIYSISRTILNVLRSIEPLILGIVFVVWVGLGPFAGVMALMLHSIAALGKLFSEQVEGIAEGPVEAITATGANRLQTIAYAVIPQVVPPFVAFSFYRWDINVRLSTIIGFVGGGGIGFVLSQNIQQLRYQQASVMMIAIAIVVSALDYVSSHIRRRII
jgi:phosphonate ABC transporter permease subunit PhnE